MSSLDGVDAVPWPMTRGQKLQLFTAAVVPCLNWLLMVEESP